MKKPPTAVRRLPTYMKTALCKILHNAVKYYIFTDSQSVVKTNNFFEFLHQKLCVLFGGVFVF